VWNKKNLRPLIPREYFIIIRRQRRPCLSGWSYDGFRLADQHGGCALTLPTLLTMSYRL